MSEAPKIKTDFIYPPVPFRHHDWCAWYDDLGEEGPVGFGYTEADAIHDLLTNYPLEDGEANP